jgi:signal transduction histidine kinase
LPDGRLAVGYLNTRYIKRVQERIAFGELGHSAIFDATGRAVAHPVQKVEENMMDASGIPTVRRMMNGETGVDQFYSPPMDAQMIAGFTFVPETGWAVMVPQPIRELSASVSANLRQTDLFIVIVSLLLAIFGWIMTRFMARPIQRFTTAGLEIAEGNYHVDLPDHERSSLEMWRLNEALKTMVNKIRQSNARLRLALEIEETENKRKSEFLIIASHELRNPLSGVIGMLAVCKIKSADEELAKYLDIAERSASQLNKIVDEMVHFAEEETDDVPIKIETFQASLELDQIAGLYQQRAHDAGLDFHYSLQDGLDVPMVTDRYRLFQIIGNLLENAIKYTTEGSVSMLVNFEQVPDSNQTWLDICISDTGIGIDDSDLERIFDPFFQVDGSFSRNYNGLGIGLSVSKSMIERLGGQIQCHSKKNKGSDFRLLIPVQLG